MRQRILRIWRIQLCPNLRIGRGVEEGSDRPEPSYQFHLYTINFLRINFQRFTDLKKRLHKEFADLKV